jgi:hypothetical protein
MNATSPFAGTSTKNGIGVPLSAPSVARYQVDASVTGALSLPAACAVPLPGCGFGPASFFEQPNRPSTKTLETTRCFIRT